MLFPTYNHLDSAQTRQIYRGLELLRLPETGRNEDWAARVSAVVSVGTVKIIHNYLVITEDTLNETRLYTLN